MKPQHENQIRDREIKLIHIAKRDLQLDDETYRAMLWSVARVRSAKDLDFTGRKKVLDHLKARGFKVKVAPANKDASDAQYRLIRALWSELHATGKVQHNTDQAVRAYIKRMSGVADFKFMNGFQINTVIESLKLWSKREIRTELAVQEEPAHG
jgi:phage gp16-like protein